MIFGVHLQSSKLQSFENSVITDEELGRFSESTRATQLTNGHSPIWEPPAKDVFTFVRRVDRIRISATRRTKPVHSMPPR